MPEQVLRNEDLTQFPEEFRPTIAEKTGILARRHAAPDEATSDLGYRAAAACLARAGVAAADVDGIVLATSSPDRMQPATATRVQDLLGARRAFAFDVNSVCTGGVYAVHVADALLQAHGYERILVVAAEVYSRILNPRDFSTYPYFGDGAGAVLLQRDGGWGEVLGTVVHADGAGADVIQVPAGGTRLPFGKVEKKKDLYFRMIGREVYEFAVARGAEVIREALERCGLTTADATHVVVHQANINIVKAIAGALDIDADRFFTNLEHLGNTAGASVLIALDEMLAARKVRAGEHIVVAGFGGGLSWGATVLRVNESVGTR